jgi:hypothetical protein
MSEFAIEVTGLLLVTYGLGCIAGCWLRRTLARRKAGI